MKKVTITEESLEWALRTELYEDMKEHAPEWLDYLGVESGEGLVRMRREGTLVLPNYKRFPPPSSE